jgi:hypothetical protein
MEDMGLLYGVLVNTSQLRDALVGRQELKRVRRSTARDRRHWASFLHELRLIIEPARLWGANAAADSSRVYPARAGSQAGD